MKSNKKGFTLIELLVIVAIIGILAAVVISSLGKARDKSKDVAITAEMNQILTAVELETDGLGVYTNVCDLFLPGGKLERFKISIEKYGGVWEGCEDDEVSYSVLVTLNSGNYAFELINRAYAAAKVKKKDGVHSSKEDKPILFKDEDLKKLREIVGKDYTIQKPQYYCVGMKPSIANQKSVMKGFMYDVAKNNFTGCGVLLEKKLNSDILIAAKENGVIKELPNEKIIEEINKEIAEIDEKLAQTQDPEERAKLTQMRDKLIEERNNL